MNGMGPGMIGRRSRCRHDGAIGCRRRLFMNQNRIARTVTIGPEIRIRTVTESVDPRIAQLIKEHVTSSNGRVEAAWDPGLPMESDALHAIFERVRPDPHDGRDPSDGVRRRPDVKQSRRSSLRSSGVRREARPTS